MKIGPSEQMLLLTQSELFLVVGIRGYLFCTRLVRRLKLTNSVKTTIPAQAWQFDDEFRVMHKESGYARINTRMSLAPDPDQLGSAPEM